MVDETLGYLRFGRFELQARQRRLLVDNQPALLGPRAFDLLLVLATRAGQLVTKEELLEQVWPRLVVEENNLSVQVSGLRKILGPDVIETVAGSGYRFNATIDAASGERTHNLPLPLTSFIGHESDLERCAALLEESRMLTLTGIGGGGKTRLALELARRVLPSFAGGVWFVDLAPVSDPARVPHAVASALDVGERPGRDLVDVLCAHLSGKSTLLLLDNCEHLVAACAALAERILMAAPGPRVLATSREGLGIAGERVVPVRPLESSEAVRLFVERAQLVAPEFIAAPDTLPLIADVCRRLDGIPLAIELAAAWVKLLSIGQIRGKLDDRFRLLTGGSKALSRHRTLLTTLQWSYEHLAADEQRLLRRLAVFAGGWTLPAATTVAGESEDETTIVEILGRLVDKSLVMVDRHPSAAPRYRMLETVREYARERLSEYGEGDAMARRHARYFRDLFKQSVDVWLRGRDEEWEARYGPELDNLRTALAWSFHSGGDLALGAELAATSGSFWFEAGSISEGRQYFEMARANIASLASHRSQAELWLWTGLLSGETAASGGVEAFQRSADLYCEVGDDLGLGYSLARLGRSLAHMGRFDAAEAAFAEALPLLDRAAVPNALGGLFKGWGTLAMLKGDGANARSRWEKALSLFRQGGSSRSHAYVLGHLAELAWADGDLHEALDGCRETVAAMRSLRRKRFSLGWTLGSLAGIHVERGELDQAMPPALESVSLLSGDGGAYNVLDHLALRCALVTHLRDAARLAGYTDFVFATNKTVRPPNEARARDRLEKMLRDNLEAAEREGLSSQGAGMSEEDACRLAVQDWVLTHH